MKNYEIDGLTNNEKLELIERLWDSIDNPDELVPFNPMHKKIIDDRLSKINDDTKWFTLRDLKEALRSLHD
jgi:putative addiction module component (TIGR02574 family)